MALALCQCQILRRLLRRLAATTAASACGRGRRVQVGGGCLGRLWWRPLTCCRRRRCACHRVLVLLLHLRWWRRGAPRAHDTRPLAPAGGWRRGRGAKVGVRRPPHTGGATPVVRLDMPTDRIIGKFALALP